MQLRQWGIVVVFSGFQRPNRLIFKIFFCFLFMLVKKISKRVNCCSFYRLFKHAQPKRRHMFCHVHFFLSIQLSSKFSKNYPNAKFYFDHLSPKLLQQFRGFSLFSKCCASRVPKIVGKSITWACGRRLGPRNLYFFGPRLHSPLSSLPFQAPSLDF